MTQSFSDTLIVKTAIATGKFFHQYVKLPIEKFPLAQETLNGVKELHFDEHLTARGIKGRVHSANKRFASPLTALRYATKYPEKQLQYPLAVFFEVDNQIWCLILGNEDSERTLRVEQLDLDTDEFVNFFRFLVVDQRGPLDPVSFV